MLSYNHIAIENLIGTLVRASGLWMSGSMLTDTTSYVGEWWVAGVETKKFDEYG